MKKIKETNKKTQSKKEVKQDKSFIEKLYDFFGNLSDKTSKISKFDIVVIGLLVLIYLVMSFYNLGTLDSPKTYYHFQNVEEEVNFELEEAKNISIIRYYTGAEVGEFSIYASNDGQKYKEVAKMVEASVFAWEDLTLDANMKYLKIVSNSGNSYISEIQLYDTYGEKVNINSLDDKSKVLIDEANIVPAQISYLNSTYFDEIYFARSAYEYIHGIDAMEWVHPPLGKLIMAIPILLFGMSTFSYRLMGTIAGVLMIPVIYILAKRMFKNSKWAFLAGILMTFDCFHFAQTRMGTVDSFLVLFIMLSSLFMYQYIDLDSKEKFTKKIKNLGLSGLFIGCAIATKWTGLYAGLALAIIFFGDLVYKSVTKKEKGKDLLKIIFMCLIFFIIVPVIIYVLCYLLFPNVVCYGNNSISGILEQIKNMYSYHSTLEETHPFQSSWYTWPVMYKPVWYYVQYYGGNIKGTIVGIGNPAIWWFGVIAQIFVLINAFSSRKKEDLFILILILCCFLPYAFIDRAMFMYHYFPVLPFVMLAIVQFTRWITAKFNSSLFYILYIIVVIMLFLFFYPVISGMVTSSDYIDSLKWLSSWIF